MLYLKQSTASQSVLIGPFVDSTDGVTAETGLTIANTDIRLSKNGGNLAAKNSGGGTHDENGWYTITLDATDTDTVGRLQVHAAMSGALPVWAEFQVLEEAIFDALFGASAGGFDANGRVDVALIEGVDATDQINAAADTAISDAALATAAALATVDTVVDAIKAVTDALPDSGALSSLATAAGLSTVDTVVDAIKAKTDSLTFTVAGEVDANMLSISGDSTAADRLEEGATAVITGTVDASPTPTTTAFAFTGTNGHTADATDDHYNGLVVKFTTGALAGQATTVGNYTGSTNVLTVTALTEAPSNGDAFVIL